MPPKPDPKALIKLRDDRVRAEITKRVFSSLWAWSVIYRNGPASGGFSWFPTIRGSRSSRILLGRADEGRPLVARAKIMRCALTLASSSMVAKEHGSFGKFLANCRPPTRPDAQLLAKPAAAASAAPAGQMLLGFSARTPFGGDEGRGRLSALTLASICGGATSKRASPDPEQFTAWARDGLPYGTCLSSGRHVYRREV